MMTKYYSGALLGLLMIFSSGAYALECDVAFRATKITIIEKWYGSIEKPEFKAGQVSGEGVSRKACVQDALTELKQDGWKITYHEMVKVYE